MNEQDMIDLFWQRSERAVIEASENSVHIAGGLPGTF